MKPLSSFASIYIYRQPVDMRKSINGLSIIVDQEMKLDLQASSLFIFCNKKRTHMKALYFDRSGFALWLKKLDQSKFPWPKGVDIDVINVNLADLELLLEGINIWTRFESVHFEQII
jgi:transposase